MVVYLLQEQVASEIATLILNHIKTNVVKEVTNHVITVISLHVTNIHKSAESLHNNIDELNNTQNTLPNSLLPLALEATVGRAKEAADTVLSSIQDVQNAILLLTPSLDTTQNYINSLLTNNKAIKLITNEQPTYSAALKTPPTTKLSPPSTTNTNLHTTPDHQGSPKKL